MRVIVEADGSEHAHGVARIAQGHLDHRGASFLFGFFGGSPLSVVFHARCGGVILTPLLKQNWRANRRYETVRKVG